jgi:putrescine transport system permease protein
LRTRRQAVLLLLPALLVLVGLFLLPQAFMFVASLWQRSTYGGLEREWTLLNYVRAVEPLYLWILVRSLVLATATTVLCLLVGWPVAWWLGVVVPRRFKNALLVLVILPFWTSFLIRVYAWIGILKPNGLLNNFLAWLGIIDAPLTILHTQTAVYIGVVYSYLPFMILPLYANLTRMDMGLLEAAADLGCRPFKAFLKVTLPLSLPGILAGSMLVSIPVVGEFVIPDLLGGPGSLMVGKMLWTEFFGNKDWPLAAAVAISLLGLLVAPFMLMRHLEQKLGADDL